MSAKTQALKDMKNAGLKLSFFAYDKLFNRKQFNQDVKDIKASIKK